MQTYAEQMLEDEKSTKYWMDLLGKSREEIDELIPLSPMRFKRCGECGCPAHGGANDSGHAANCSKYDHRQV